MSTIKKIVFLFIASVMILTPACNDKDLVVNVEGIMLDTMSLFLVLDYPGHDTYQLMAAVYPDNAANQKVVWTSNNRDVATVSDNGLVTAKDVGEAKIFATTEDGGFRMACLVLVFNKPIPVAGISFKEPAIEILIGQGRTLLPDVIFDPVESTDKSLRWLSDDATTVSVTVRGYIDALKVGKTTITAIARSSDGLGDWYHSATCVVTVKAAPIPVSSVSLNKTTLELALGMTEALTANVLPANADVKEVDWVSDNPAVATVSETGLVTAVKKGTATITATSKENSEKFATCTVSVVNMDEVTLSLGDNLLDAIAANPGKTIVLPAGYIFTWSSTPTLPAGGFIVEGNPTSRAVISVTTGTTLNLNGRTGKEIYRFENVEFVQTTAGNGNYFINQGTNTTDHACDIQELSFENCRFSGYGRSIVRTQTNTQTFGLVRFNNCIIENGSNQDGQHYAVVQSSVAGVTAFTNIEITNSTVKNNHAHFINVSGADGSAKNVLIKNVTFYNVLGANNSQPNESITWFINAGTGTPMNITIQNCILGSVKNSGLVRAINMHADGTLVSEGNYATTDWVTVLPDPQGNVVQVPAEAYAGNCEALFTNPASGDFSIKDASFAGKGMAGDPRWW